MQADGAVSFNDFSGGLNLYSDKFSLETNQYLDGDNLYMDKIRRVVKRKGRVLYNATPLGAAITSLHRISASTGGFLAKCGTTLYQSNSLNGTWTSLVGSLTTYPTHGFEETGWFYYADGTNMYKYNLTNNYAWGVPTPTTAITATPSGTGSAFPIVTGYSYAYSYYNSTTLQASEYKTGTTTGADLTADKVVVGVTASTDPQVDKIKLWRTTDGGSIFYLHSTIANTTASINDTTADGALGSVYADSGNAVPPASRFAVKIHNRAVVMNASHYLSASQVGEYESFPLTGGYRFYVRHGSGVETRGIAAFGDATQNVLLVFKSTSIVAIYGLQNESPALWEFLVLDERKGLHAENSLAGDGGVLYWMSLHEGTIKVFEISMDSGIMDVSILVKPLFQLASKTIMKNACGWYYDGKYFISFPGKASSTVNDATYFYDSATKSWHPYSKTVGIRSAVVFPDTGAMYAGDVASGYVDQLETSIWTDRGADFGSTIKTRYDNCGAAGRIKKFWNVYGEYYGSYMTMWLRSELGAESMHTTDTDMMPDEVLTSPWVGGWVGGWYYAGNLYEMWVGGWLGGWNGEGSIGYSRDIPVIIDEKAAQGTKGRYAYFDISSKADDNEFYFCGAQTDFEVEAKT